MGVGYFLVNYTRKETIRFVHIPASKERELAGNPVSAAITTWYFLHHPQEAVAFVSDTYDDWPFADGSRADDLGAYAEVTDRVVQELIEAGILVDEGIAWADEDEPETIYVRALRNCWMD